MDAKTVSAFNAKNALGRLLDRVEAGEEIVITRHGSPVARLVPVDDDDQNAAGRAIDGIVSIRKSLEAQGVKVSRKEVKQWRSQGRR